MDRQQLKQLLLDVMERSVGERIEDVSEDQNLREGLKLDSIDLLSMAIELQSQMNIHLDAEDFEKIVTVGDLMDLVLERAKSARKAA